MNEFNEKKTTWINDSEETVRFKLYKEIAGGKQKMVPVTIEIEPGKQTTLPSYYDSSIRKERDGLVVGGLCPWLRKKNEKSVNLIPELDFFTLKKEQEVTTLAKKLRNEKDLEEAAKLLNQK